MEDGKGGQGERQRGVNGDMPYASTPSAAAPAVSAGETVRLDDGSKAEYAELQGVVSHGNTVDEGGEPAKVDATADMEAWLLEAIEAEKENTEVCLCCTKSYSISRTTHVLLHALLNSITDAHILYLSRTTSLVVK
jgi:hypothetical protein